MSSSDEKRIGASRAGIWPWVVFLGCLLLAFGLGLLIVSIMERRWETVQPQLVVRSLGEWETDNAKWGQNYPREYESFRRTRTEDTRTKFGGAWQRDYLEEDPRQVVLFAGYGFSRDYKQARGHAWSVEDILHTGRTTKPDGTDTGMPGTCWTCKSSQIPSIMHQMGISSFYNSSWLQLKGRLKETIGCLDCHDPKTMNLRVSRPALREAFARQGRDIDQATHQELRSLVCAQCHVEYYFANNPDENKAQEQTFGHKGKYLVFPWDRGTSVESMEQYYAARPEFYDWLHPVSGTRMIKIQHPDWEVYSTGVHAYRQVSCADCHMPYRTEGGVKFTNHFIQSPLLDISSSCNVCHRWSEQEVRARVEGMQTKHQALKIQAEQALVHAHFDVAACRQAGATDGELKPLRDQLWRAQLRWDYVSAHNGMGFHSPQENVIILGQSISLAEEARLQAARLLAGFGYAQPPLYPDISTREKALAVILPFEAAVKDERLPPPSLLPAKHHAPDNTTNPAVQVQPVPPVDKAHKD